MNDREKLGVILDKQTDVIRSPLVNILLNQTEWFPQSGYLLKHIYHYYLQSIFVLSVYLFFDCAC